MKFYLILASGNIDAVFDSWRGTIMGTMLSFVQRFLSPIVAAVSIIVAFIIFAKAAAERNRQQEADITKYIFGIVLCIAVAAIAGSFWAWGAQFFN